MRSFTEPTLKIVEADERRAARLGFSEHMHEAVAYCRMVLKSGGAADIVLLGLNPRFTEITSLTNAESDGIDGIILWLAKTDPELLEVFGRVVATGKPEKLEHFTRLLNLWLSFSVFRPEPDHFVVMVDAISERSRENEARTLSLEMIDRSYDGIHIVDSDPGSFLADNESASQALG